MKINNKKDIFAFCFNITLVILTLIGVFRLFVVEKSGWTGLKWYTTDSNLLLGIASIISISFMIHKWRGKIKVIPQWVDIVKLTATATVSLTMFITICFLTPALALTGGKPANLYTDSSLIFHVLSPILAILTFILFESNKDIKLTKTLYSLIPTVIYAIFYMSMAYTHVGPDGLPLEEYDWYWFCRIGGNIAAPFVLLANLGFFYLFSWLLWLGNRKINIKCLAK